MRLVRKLTGGPLLRHSRADIRNEDDRAVNTMAYTRHEVERVSHMAFKLARNRHKKVTSVDKSNVIEVSQLWRKVVIEVAARVIRTSHSTICLWTTRPCNWC